MLEKSEQGDVEILKPEQGMIVKETHLYVS